LKKKQEKKKLGVIRLTRWVDPARPGQKPDCNPLTFVFLLKRRRFDLKKKELTQMTRSKPETRILNRTGS
jgi:hypothetical protein